MSEPTYRIWFEHAETKRGEWAPSEPFHNEAAAATLCEHWNATNNGAWRGTFSVVEIVDGTPGA